MSVHFKKFHPALKHAAYSASSLLPGEDRAAFEQLHRALVEELGPGGALEEDIVFDLARLIWRKRNLATCRVAELTKARREEIRQQKKADLAPWIQKEEEAADEQARQEFGDIYELIDIGNSATFDGLNEELDLADRLQGMINRCLKQLLMVRGVKSLSSPPASGSPPQITSPRKVG